MGRLVKVTEGGEVSVLNESFGHPKCEERPIPCEFLRAFALDLALAAPTETRLRLPPMRAWPVTFVLSSFFVAAFLSVPGCGGDEDPPEEEPQGNSIQCGSLICDEKKLPGNYPPIPACCAANGECGLDGSQFEQYGANFEEKCQPLDQPGEVDKECPTSTPVDTDFGPLSFPGCCTPAGKCGYFLDNALGLIDLGLGCVDAQPFLDAGEPASCTPGPDGAGGAGGAGGQ